MIALAAVVLALTGSPAQVVTYQPFPCSGEAVACANIPGRVIYLNYRLAYDLKAVVTGRPLPPWRAAFAILTLAHEARHLMGELNERRTDAWAIVHFVSTARLLGVPDARIPYLRSFV